MNSDSNVAESSLSAAELAAVLESFKKALQSGDIQSDGASTFNFEDWLTRVDAQHRSSLEHHLTHLAEHHRAAMTETSDQLSTNLDLRAGSDLSQAGLFVADATLPTKDAAHRAVFSCYTLHRLPDKAKAALAAALERREFEAGDRLLRQGEASAGLHLLLSGRVEIVDVSGARNRRIDYDGPGSVLGEMSLLTGQDCSADVIAMIPTVALVLPVKAFEGLRQEFPELEIALSQLVSDRLGQRSHDALCGKTVGEYKLVHCINRGAMGVVYAAERTLDGAPRALKMLRHRFISDSRALSRFDFEVDLLSKLCHDNIVQMHGHFVAYRTRFLVLDLCDGADLKRTLTSHGPMDEATVKAVLGQIAAGLQYAHVQGALHLDLKPANILVDRRGKVSITDFGLGRLIKSDGCEESIAGTPAYMSPEQFHGLDIGPECDWYSLGCLGYELLTGKLLFPEQDLSQMFNRKHFLANEIWPALEVGEELRVALHSALEPMVAYRDLDLKQIATWAKPVPELAVTL